MSNNAESELHGRSKELLRVHEIDDRQSEPHHQHQNPVKRKIQDLKRMMNSVVDRTGCPKKWWLVCALFVIVLFNHMPNANGDIPLSEITARIVDISKFMHFHCWQEVFVEKPDGGEEEAWWAVPALDTGDELTCLVVLKESEALAPRSDVCALQRTRNQALETRNLPLDRKLRQFVKMTMILLQ